MDNFNIFNKFNILNSTSNRAANLVGQNSANLQNPENPDLTKEQILNKLAQNIQSLTQKPTINPGGQSAQNTLTGQNGLAQTNVNIFQNVNYEALVMDKDTLSKYLQTLLKLPDSVDKFVAELKNISQGNAQNGAQNKELLAKILSQDLIVVKNLNEFLNKNTADAIQKLYEAMSYTLKQGAKDASQLKDIIAILSVIQSNTNLNPNSIKEFLLLYLPLSFGLQEFQSNPVDFSRQESIEESDFDITIMFETINFSNIMASIKQTDTEIFVNFYSNNLFPYSKFEKIIKLAVHELNINIDLEKTNIAQIDTQKETPTAQSFKVNSSGLISPNVLILSHLIIKTVFRMDTDFNQSLT